jgi:hypothetical protein
LKNFLLLIFFYCVSLNISAQSNSSYWQQHVDYTINVSLNDSLHTLDGFVKIKYTNNSPDTLSFIWFHLWPNAYKNDKTAFSEQLLKNGRTDFYFADETKLGFINGLQFKADELDATFLLDSLHIDIAKLFLPKPLLSGQSIYISTPFHVKLPYNFSRSGYVDSSFQITQWYPKPAVYDKDGWHPIPYLDQGEFYSEFGNFDVTINTQKDFIIAATGKKINENTNGENKTSHYIQSNIHDFAWFADKQFTIEHDTLQLNKRIIDLYAYHLNKNEAWSNSIRYIKAAIQTKSNWIGEYPYDIVSIVESRQNNIGGMEYPTITLLENSSDKKSLDNLINHEVGHNWFYGILGTNERLHPWMDEGVNSFYDDRYSKLFYNQAFKNKNFFSNKFPDSWENLIMEEGIHLKKDQPIETNSENFSSLNYGLIAYHKSAEWLKRIENKLGKNLFDSCMKAYYDVWKFKHPSPIDFKRILESTSKQNLDSEFSLLNKKGYFNEPQNKKLRFTFLGNLYNTEKYNYVSFAPAIGYNHYDGVMLGTLLHNYSLPQHDFQFYIAPLYSIQSKSFNGSSKLSFTKFIGDDGNQFIFSIAASKYSIDKYKDKKNNNHFLYFKKISPSIKYVFGNCSPLEKIKKSIEWKSFFVTETNFNFITDTINQVDIITTPSASYFVNQLRYVIENNRILYPYSLELESQQTKDFIKTGVTGKYYLNYPAEGGLQCRLFAGKFIYTKSATIFTQFNTERYHINLSGANGYEDYTYNNYFLGRNNFDGIAARQMIIKDGGFKIRTDLLSEKIGKSDNWVCAVNFVSTIPKKINPLELLPIKIPLLLFTDVGTHAGTWKAGATTEKIYFNGGVQFSFFKKALNIYCPIVYSSSFRNYVNSTIPKNKFLHNISFSLDLQQLSIKNLVSQITL